jgi:hypothetical protein
MNTRNLARLLGAMLLISCLLATVSVTYAAQEGRPKMEYSCCAGFPPCTERTSKCGWCCLNSLSFVGTFQRTYDSSCNVVSEEFSCNAFSPCGVFGCAP